MHTTMLESVGNPDFDQFAPISPPRKAKSRTLDGLREQALAYIKAFGLGAGNWPEPLVYENGKPVGWLSYNGRYWAEGELLPGGTKRWVRR